jgi:hypothetical protein
MDHCKSLYQLWLRHVSQARNARPNLNRAGTQHFAIIFHHKSTGPQLAWSSHYRLLRISNEFQKRILQKGKDERAGVGAPDLMSLYRHHSHVAEGQPCYLDK